ncbi:MAG: biotin--[acetyl-CoA-carboxylase] ligase [bacterium]|nr:biotin--[acetyl-CoA-carboxylase] ligase [bacterium]
MKNRVLEMLQSAEGYISGEAISGKLGISRNAVWKHINKLRSEGYGIESVTNRGYRLNSSPDIISAEKIQENMNTEFIGRKIVYMEETDSTNNAAKAAADMPDGTLFISEIQTSGKGRLGRAWESPKGIGIWMSLLLKPEILPQDVAQITLVVGMAAAKGIGCGAKIKWPNDVVIGTKKVCGILTEMSAEIERVNYVVTGIGINVNTEAFDGELSEKATSLYIETGKKCERCGIIRAFLENFEALYKKFLRGGIAALAEDYRELCITIGKEVSVIYPNRTINGKAVDINNEGELIVETETGTVTVGSGEVSIRGIYGYV